MAVLLGLGLTEEAARVLAGAAENGGHEFTAFPSLEAARAGLRRECAIVFSFLSSGQKESWPSFAQAASLPGWPDLVALFPKGDGPAGEFAIQAGCWDAVSLPLDQGEALLLIGRCLAQRNAGDFALAAGVLARDGIIGDSPALERALRQLGRVAPTDSSVLILGETGTGKELFAKALHDNSPRAARPLVVVDCTNLPPTLAESILFGHERGSFTGAVASTDGLFKQADGGTVFLDEIGDLALGIQKALLRVIQEKRFRPLSAAREVSCDFRVIAATNRNLEEMVRQGSFRQDLYHRLNAQSVILPPLRERAEDIPALAAHYIEMFCRAQACAVKQLAPETLTALALYPWPGNVRELINAMQSAVLNAGASPLLYPQHLPEDLRIFMVRSGITMRDLGKMAPWGGASAAAQAFSGGSQPLPVAPAAPTGQDFGPAPGCSDAFYAASANAFLSRDASPAPAAGQPSASCAAQGAGQAPGTADEDADAFDFASLDPLPTFKEARERAVDFLEERYLEELVRRSGGNAQTAQELSGLSRARLYDLLKAHSISLARDNGAGPAKNS
ncbi:sigma-54 dependent transcriptional regulator [Desulfovibrio sp. OttesenSCG-928-C14]|nr:sigma-54 dependent transcriptional regulator [Desulfovibrio sp. OttesenSCG-928-C14]